MKQQQGCCQCWSLSAVCVTGQGETQSHAGRALPQLRGRDFAFKGLPHTLRCKQVNPKYLQSLLHPVQELVTDFAVWLEAFESRAEGGRKGGMYLLLLLPWAHG